MTRLSRFTGWHMLGTMVAFFGVIIAVNMTMATLATRTFGGVVVKNSYVAGQKFNGWLAEAEAQRALGWALAAESVDRRILVRGESGGDPLASASVTAIASHPLGRVAEVPLRFAEVEPGRYVAQTRLPAGRWRVQIKVTRGSDRVDAVRDIVA